MNGFAGPKAIWRMLGRTNRTWTWRIIALTRAVAEKAIKAVFVSRSETFPYIHDLKKLIHLLKRNGVTIPKYLLQAEELTRYAFVTRYPGKDSSATERQYRHAVRIAAAVLRWAQRQVGSP